jgi:PleD family two-component response regulator
MAGFPGGGATAEAVLDAADQAMYRAKARGKRGIEGSDFAPL